MQRIDVLSVERGLWSVDIERKVDASIVQQLHGLVVVATVVDCVDTDGVDSQIFEGLNILAELLQVQQRILSVSRTTWLVGDTANVEALSALCPECVAFRDDRWEISLALAWENLCGSEGGEGQRAGAEDGLHRVGFLRGFRSNSWGSRSEGTGVRKKADS